MVPTLLAAEKAYDLSEKTAIQNILTQNAWNHVFVENGGIVHYKACFAGFQNTDRFTFGLFCLMSVENADKYLTALKRRGVPIESWKIQEEPATVKIWHIDNPVKLRHIKIMWITMQKPKEGVSYGRHQWVVYGNLMKGISELASLIEPIVIKGDYSNFFAEFRKSLNMDPSVIRIWDHCWESPHMSNRQAPHTIKTITGLTKRMARTEIPQAPHIWNTYLYKKETPL